MDLRVPSGSFFTLVGLILLWMGAFKPHAYAAPLTTENVNLYTGAAMLVFGLFLLLMAWRATRMEKGSNP